MAAAYAALVSIMQIIDQLQRHPTPPISLHKQQVQSLTEIVTFLQQFLEAGYSNDAGYSDEADPLEMRIADAAHAAEDVIESHIVDQILADREEISSVDFYVAVQKVIDNMEHVKKEAMDVMKQKMRSDYGADSSTAAASSIFDGPEQYRTMVGFDEILIQVLDKLTSQGSRRHVISITGMGGMGKTTLAKNVYQHQLVAEHFDFLAWVKVSQQYKIRKLLLKLLEGEEQNLSQVDEHELGLILHKKLTGRRYLIIIDDIWDIQVWNRLRVFLPDNNSGSRIIITTRLSNLARQIDDSHIMEMDILDEENSWKLFCKHVFGEEDCPPESQGIGKQIVEGCKGLPLSISVVGGLLSKFKRTEQYWEHIAENLNSTVNLEGDKHCLQLLYTSYNNLPIHLKPCFLFIGVISGYSEDFLSIILIAELFIGEGFVKPISGKSLEEAAKEYIIELIERNLIIIDKTDKTLDWMYKGCRIHDLLRDLCLKESQKQKFVYVVGERSLDTNIPHSIDSIRRICVAKNTPEVEVLPILESASHLRSLLGERVLGIRKVSSVSSRLLRVDLIHGLEDVVEKVNLRVIFMGHSDQYINISSILSHFWNLQMFIVVNEEWSHVVTAPYEIWMMPLLRSIYLMTPLSLPDPPSCEMDCNSVLENLHTLVGVNNFKCSEEVVKRIPHIKYLVIFYTEVEGSYDVDYNLNNLGRLHKLETLVIEVRMQSQIVQNHDITYPRSLLLLSLSGTALHWDDITTKIGYLPLLQQLILGRDSCIGAKWETIQGQFCSLRLLSIKGCGDLEYWMTENTHFPRLEELCLEGLHKLKEIPSSVGDIPTLQLIKLEDCCHSLYSSAQRINEEQEELGNEDLQVKIVDDEYKSQGESSLEHETENED